MSDQPDWNITASELKPRLGQVVLLDVRQPEENAQCKIPGSILIPLGELETRAARELDPSKEIVVYCAHGVRSVRGLMSLRMMGFSKTKSLEGGIAAWQEAGFTTS